VSDTPISSKASGPAPLSAEAVPEKPGRRWVHLPHSRPRRFQFLAVYLLFCGTLVYAGEKLFWKLYAGVPFGKTAEIWDQYYPMIGKSQLKETHPRRSDERFDILLLGGSAITPQWAPVERMLAGKLREELDDRFRIFNFAFPAQTSRDSVLKYSRLADEQFELVVVYDGFNDARLNCVRRDEFRDDYTHVAWYRAMKQQLETGSTRFPMEIVKEMFKTMPLGAIDPALVDEGRDIKTVRPFRQNLETIIATAGTRGDKVLLLTYAYDIPADYTPERLARGEIAYGKQSGASPLSAEMWGKPANVVAAVDAHNSVIRLLAVEYTDVLFVDEQEMMPKQQRLFLDPCHLTDEGSRRFVDNLWPAVAQRIAHWKASRATGHRIGKTRRK
jgi:hypothetical protein